MPLSFRHTLECHGFAQLDGHSANHPATLSGRADSLAQRIVPHTQDWEVSLFQKPFSELRMVTVSPEAQLHPGAISLQAGPRSNQHFQKPGPSKSKRGGLQGRGPPSSHDHRCPSGQGSGHAWEGRRAPSRKPGPVRARTESVSAPHRHGSGRASGRTGRARPGQATLGSSRETGALLAQPIPSVEQVQELLDCLFPLWSLPKHML